MVVVGVMGGLVLAMLFILLIYLPYRQTQAPGTADRPLTGVWPPSELRSRLRSELAAIAGSVGQSYYVKAGDQYKLCGEYSDPKHSLSNQVIARLEAQEWRRVAGPVTYRVYEKGPLTVTLQAISLWRGASGLLIEICDHTYPA